MPIQVHLPRALRGLAGGQGQVDVDAPDGPLAVADLVALLEPRCPGISVRVLEETGGLRPHVSVFVDGNAVPRGDSAALVGPGAEVWILPAVSGG